MPDQEKVNVLLVDDRPENLVSLAAVLDRSDYRLIQAGSGTEALRHLLSVDVAVILMDVQMPILDGFETAALIKQREKSRHIPIIFLTAVGREEPFLSKGYDAGAVDYIIKPVDPQILRSKVAVFTELYRKTKLLQSQEIARKELEFLRREQNANRKYRELVDGIHDGFVWAADPRTLEFTFISPNSVDVLGQAWRPGLGWMELLDPLARARIGWSVPSALPRDHETSFEHKISRPDGRILWLKTTARLSERFDGTGDELRGLSVNITELKTAQEEAERATRLRDEFLSIASHELKTPLTALTIGLQNLRRQRSRLDPVEFVSRGMPPVLERSVRQVDRLSKLVDELLDVSRINGGKLSLFKEKLDLAELVRDVCQRLSDEAQRAESKIELTVPDALQGSWDRMRAEQIVTNLVSNAIKYGSRKPVQVTLTRLKEGKAQLSVKDHGIGIAEKDQERIFRKYERAVTDHSISGLGLGLYITQQIIEAHGGTIQVRSAPGEGSEFIVTLPCQIGRPSELRAPDLLSNSV